jgi:hypothetical protein
MTNVEAVEFFKAWVLGLNLVSGLRKLDDLESRQLEAYKFAIKALEAQTEVNIYVKEETYHNCTVQVLTNTVTGQTSVGWWIDNG